MADKESAGDVSLELRIENTAAEQLSEIADDASKSAQKSFGGVQKIIQRSINKPLEKAQKLYAEWGKTSRNLSDLSGKNIKTPKGPKVNTAHFEVANNALDLMEQKLGNISAQIGAVNERLLQTEKEYSKIGAERGFGSEDAVKLENELTSLQSKLISLQSSAISTEEKLGKSFSEPAEKARKAYQKKYDDIMKRADAASKQAVQWAMRAEKAQSRSASRTARQAEKAYSKQAEACKRYANRYADAQADSSDKAVRAMDKAYAKMERMSERASKKAQKASMKTAKSASKGASLMGNAFKKVGKTIRHSLKAVFVTAVLYKFFKAFKEGIGGAISQNKQFAKSMNAIKANLSVAFTPIIEAIMPMLTRLAQGLATVTKYISSFIAAIFGKTYKQAVNSTKKLQGQAKKAQASTSRDFDELHNVDKNENENGSGPDYSAIDTSALDTGPMRKFQEILDKTQKTLEKITPSLKHFYDKGIKPVTEWVGGKMKDAFSFVGKQFEKFGNWLVENNDKIAKLGDSLGRLWSHLEPILNAAWDTTKAAISGLFDGLLDTFSSILNIAPDIVDFVSALFEGGDWSEIKEIGKNILAGFWEGIQQYWENMKKGFSTLWEGCINIVKSIFGIHSPSTVFSDIGKNLVQGLINGIEELWSNLTSMSSEKLESLKNSFSEKFSHVKDSVLGKLREIKSGAKSIFSEIWSGTKDFINKMLGGVENMINKPVQALNKFIDKLNALKVNVPEALGGGTIGFNVGRFNSVSIPKLAKGGIVDKPTLSLIGERGREAVVPLENNTGWMDKLVSMFGNTMAAVFAPFFMQLMQRIPQTDGGPQREQAPFKLDGQTVATILYDVIKKYPDLG